MAIVPDQPAIVQLIENSAKNFVASLSPDENALFQSTKAAESLLQEVEIANNKHKDVSISRKAAVALLPFIAGIEQYGQALDVFANSNDLLCPIWGGIRVVLHVRNDFGTVCARRTYSEYTPLACESIQQIF
jgi:hypothetical protein